MTGNTRSKRNKRLALHNEQGGKCHLCGEQIDMSITNPRDRRSPTLDHIVPQACGGKGWRKENLKLAHMGCNIRRGMSLLTQSET